MVGLACLTAAFHPCSVQRAGTDYVEMLFGCVSTFPSLFALRFRLGLLE